MSSIRLFCQIWIEEECVTRVVRRNMKKPDFDFYLRSHGLRFKSRSFSVSIRLSGSYYPNNRQTTLPEKMFDCSTVRLWYCEIWIAEQKKRHHSMSFNWNVSRSIQCLMMWSFCNQLHVESIENQVMSDLLSPFVITNCERFVKNLSAHIHH